MTMEIRMNTPTFRLLAVALVGALALAGCKKKEPVPVVPDMAPVATPAPMPSAAPAPAPAIATVSGIELGNAVGPDNRVTTAMTTFAAGDTIYGTVTTAAPTGNLEARWSYLGAAGSTALPTKVDTQAIALSGGSTTHAFHVSKPGGWPVGRYRLEVSLDGNVLQTRDFEVR